MVYLDFFARDSGDHSISNSPGNVYAQLAGEYGIIGLACFAGLYLFYFTGRKTLRGYGFPVLLLLAGAFMADYWFEQLSVVPMAELLLLLNMKCSADDTTA
jgi:O-antigen ligase